MKNLYHFILDDHFRNPRNSRFLDAAHIKLTNVNPLCGDIINIQTCYHNGILTEIGIQADGCVISVATASLLSEHVLQKQIAEIEAINEQVICNLIGMELGPTRLKCALMGLKALLCTINELKKSC
ncbi:iron-sulfur cluster assembly scaffold protein [bacterium]|nr:MAG: iron-sulfur cluster assembly scaffold protein [bacterium]QQR62176.1 MAG: iron-sulfur cluster assembly scaffold protein [bacterium]QQR63266.1 MAG: iron-sulfur cluster assembly scaffold protein [bacterium]